MGAPRVSRSTCVGSFHPHKKGMSSTRSGIEMMAEECCTPSPKNETAPSLII